MIAGLLLAAAAPAFGEATVISRSSGKTGMTYIFYQDGTEVARGASRSGEDGSDGALQTVSGEIPTGPIMEYYPNGRMKREWEYAANPDGTHDLCKHAEYYKSGKMKSRVLREGCGPSTQTFIYFESGIPSSITMEEGGSGDRTMTTYYDSPEKKVKSLVVYRNDKLEGPGKFYFENGKLESEIPYQEGKTHGLVKSYYKSGALKSEMGYSKGVLDGPYRMFYPTGKLQGEGVMKDGQPEGAQKEYFEDGRLKREDVYKDGKKVPKKAGKKPTERP